MQQLGILMDWYRDGIVSGAAAYCSGRQIQLDVRFAQRPDWADFSSLKEWSAAIVHVSGMNQLPALLQSNEIPIVGLSRNTDQSIRVLNCLDSIAKLFCDELVLSDTEEVFIPEDHRLSHSIKRETCDALEAHARANTKLKVTRIPLRMGEMEKTREVLEEARQQIPGKFAIMSPNAGELHELQLLLLKHQWELPKDCSMLTFDKDIQGIAANAPCPLSAVEPDYWKRGYQAAKLAHRMMKKQQVEPGDRLVKPTGLVRRKSTGNLIESDPNVERLIGLIHQYGYDDISVGDLIEKVGLGRRSLENRFREFYNCSPLEYLTKWRLERCQQLLKTTDLNLDQIAEESGLGSAQYLVRVFRKHFHMTPGDYRKEG